MSPDPKTVQYMLRKSGDYTGGIDGIIGPRTRAAIIAFKRRHGLHPDDSIGRLAWRMLFSPHMIPRSGEKPAPGAPPGEPPWMVYARRLDGLREIKGKRHNPKIIAMWEAIKAPFRDDETPWCAGFVGYCLESAGFRSTRSAGSRSYANWADGRKIRLPVPGCIVVFWRGKRKGWKGHVGFVVGRDKRGRLLVLGGNQGDAVNIKPFEQNRVIGYYWPKDHPLPRDKSLPMYQSTAAASTNEA